MRLSEKCAVCLYDKQKRLTQDEDYLAEVRELLDKRDVDDTSPYMVYLFDRAFINRFGDQGETGRYRAIKQTFNDLVLSMEEAVRQSEDLPAHCGQLRRDRAGQALSGTAGKALPPA